MSRLIRHTSILLVAIHFFIAIATVRSSQGKKNPIKLYAIYTPSHRVLVNDYFLPSLKEYNNFDIILEHQPQECPSAIFKSRGWTKTTRKKVDLILRAIHENWGSIFVFSDVDIQFFAPIEPLIPALMDGYDLRIQRNAPGDKPCTGFFICRANEKTRELWENVRAYMEEFQEVSDQLSFVRCIHNRSRRPEGLRWGYLPDMFFSAGTLEAKLWKPGQPLKTPHKIVLHHANWTVGIENKVEQLELVKSLVKKGRIQPYTRVCA
jgi:hypothetical protein